MNEALQKLKRLAAMSPSEVAHRVCEKGWLELERWSLSVRGPHSSGFGAEDSGIYQTSSFKSYLAGEPARRFYRGSKEPLGEFIQQNSPSWIYRAVVDADRLCRREMRLLNIDPVQLGAQIDWHRDPVTGRQWERLFWSDYRLENDPAGRDAKIVLELNRHQHLPRLAKAYALTGEERYAAEAVVQLESWIAQNPPGMGINWHCSLEIGIRTISWLWTIFLLLPSNSFDETAARHVGDSLFAQLEHVHRYTSVFSSPNTHLIGEATALFIAGLVFRGRKHAAIWLKQGANLLTQEAEKQILADGVYGELSSYYHSYALDFFLQALTLAEQNAFAFPESFAQKVCAMIQVLKHLTRPDGTIPLLGDDDGGCALQLAKQGYRCSREALCLGAILFRREDFKHQARGYTEEALWLLGKPGWESHQQVGDRPAEETSYYGLSGGYVSLRSGWGPKDAHLIFDCGGLGILTGGHAHADALSVVLFAGGRELLADPGTFVYNGAPEWRKYFRSTRAHNTVVIDDCDQAEMGGTFRWKRKTSTQATYHPDRTVTGQGGCISYVEAEHDGYIRLPQGGVIHRRRVVNVASRYWIVVDDFRGAGHHTFDFHFHFGDDVDIHIAEHSAAGLVMRADNAGFLFAIHATSPLEPEHFCGETAPVDGWLSRGYGEKHPGSALRARLRGAAPAGAIALLAPDAGKMRVETTGVNSGRGIACLYECDGFEDLAVWSPGDSEIEVGKFRMQGDFFWLRTENAVFKQALAIGARSLLFEGRNVMESELCAQSVES
jgi:uncharacterized heparinase superfamily protein